MHKLKLGDNNVGYIPSVIELGKLGAGLHPSIATYLDAIIQNKLMMPAIELNKSNASRYTISMDVTGTVEENEVSLSKQNARMVYEEHFD